MTLLRRLSYHCYTLKGTKAHITCARTRDDVINRNAFEVLHFSHPGNSVNTRKKGGISTKKWSR